MFYTIRFLRLRNAMPQEVIFAFLFSDSRNNTKSQWIDIMLSWTLSIAAA